MATHMASYRTSAVESLTGALAADLLGKVHASLGFFGAKGLTQDTPLADIWTQGRILQLADGPDEVHLRSIARQEVRESQRRNS